MLVYNSLSTYLYMFWDRYIYITLNISLLLEVYINIRRSMRKPTKNLVHQILWYIQILPYHSQNQVSFFELTSYDGIYIIPYYRVDSLETASK